MFVLAAAGNSGLESILSNISNVILTLGASVVLPIIIFILGLILRLSPGKAFQAAIIIGVGFIGINLVVGLLLNSVLPAAQAMVARTGVDLSIVDVGWPSTSAIAFGATVGAIAIPVGFLTNIVMLVAGLTRTLDIDFWNYWHIAFTGSLVTILTGNLMLGLLTEVVHMVILLVLADWSQPWIAKYFGYPNMSFPHGTSAPYFVLALGLNWIFDRIPGLNRLDASPETLQKRFGVFGNSMILGLIIGLVIGILAGLAVPAILTLGMAVAAVMLILPRMVAILMEGLIPVSEAAGALMRRYFPNRDLYIGLDSAILVGAPATIAASVLLVPITLALAVILPGNRTLPLVDLATIPFIVCMMVPVFRGNVVRTIIGGTLAMIPTLYIATAIAGVFTQAARNVNFKPTVNVAQSTYTSLVDGGNPLSGLIAWTGTLPQTMTLVALVVLLLIALAGAFLLRRRPPLATEPRGVPSKARVATGGARA